MADASTYLHLSEVDDIFSPEMVPSTGTLTISSVLVTLKDSAGVVNSSVNGIAATGYDTGAQATPRAWYKVNVPSLGLVRGAYTLVFVFSTTDGMTRVVNTAFEVIADEA